MAIDMPTSATSGWQESDAVGGVVGVVVVAVVGSEMHCQLVMQVPE